jgi:hypothetical protein
MMRTYKDKFPRFEYDLPKLDGFVDSSWINDVCPSMFNESQQLKLFCDYLDIDKREFPSGKVFSLYRENNCDLIELFDSDSIDEMKEFIEELNNRKFVVYWGEGYSIGESKIVDFLFFREEFGYFEEEIKAILNLSLGNSCDLGDLGSIQYVMRVK